MSKKELKRYMDLLKIRLEYSKWYQSKISEVVPVKESECI